jgi:hypothetical protein
MRQEKPITVSLKKKKNTVSLQKAFPPSTYLEASFYVLPIPSLRGSNIVLRYYPFIIKKKTTSLPGILSHEFVSLSLRIFPLILREGALLSS